MKGTTMAGRNSSEDAAADTFRWLTYVFIIVIAATNGLARIVTVTHGVQNVDTGHISFSPLLGANDRSRWCMVWALAENGSFQIDEIMEQPGWDTIDHVYKNKHFYSTKPPLLQLLVTGLYLIVKSCTGWTLLSHTHEVVRCVLIIVNWIPMVLSLAIFSWIAETFARSDWARAYVVFAAAFGTFLTTFLVTFNNHTVAAFCVLCATASTLRILQGNSDLLLFAMTGFFSGFAVAFELPAAAFLLGIGAILGSRSPMSVVVSFLPAALFPISAHFITNYLETGSVIPFYYYFGSTYYKYEINGQQSYWSNPIGIDRGLDSMPVYLFNMIIGHHGILSLTPIFLTTLVGWFRMWKRRQDELSAIQRLTCILTVVVLDFYLLQTKNYNYGGNTSGLRWMFWLIPLWLICMIPTLDRWSSRPRLRVVGIALMALSAFSAVWASGNPWSHPWIFTLWERWEWINYND